MGIFVVLPQVWWATNQNKEAVKAMTEKHKIMKERQQKYDNEAARLWKQQIKLESKQMELEGKDPKNPMSWMVPMELYRENGDVVHESDQDYEKILAKNKAKVDLHKKKSYEYGSKVVKYLETGELPDNHAISVDETGFQDEDLETNGEEEAQQQLQEVEEMEREDDDDDDDDDDEDDENVP